MPGENDGVVQTKVKPYQDGDLIFDDNSKLKKYAGPIFNVTYPPTADKISEMMEWGKLGYNVLIGYSYDLDKGFTIRVMGNIPQDVQERMKKLQIKCVLTKERGTIIDV